MATGTLELPRSPFDNVLNIVPQGHEKALKHALYNVAAVVIFGVGAGAAYAVYIILEPFIKPLLWAVLCGFVLHPFKQKLAGAAKKWLRALEASSTPLPLAVIAAPFRIADQASETLGDLLLRYLIPILAVGVGIPLSYLVYNNTPGFLVYGVQRSVLCALKIVAILTGSLNRTLVITIVLGFMLLVTFCWKPSMSKHLQRASYFVWTAVFCHVVISTGPFRIPLCVAGTTVLIIGFVAEVSEMRNHMKSKGEGDSFSQAAWAVLSGTKIESEEGKKAHLLRAVPVGKGQYGLVVATEFPNSESTDFLALVRVCVARLLTQVFMFLCDVKDSDGAKGDYIKSPSRIQSLPVTPMSGDTKAEATKQDSSVYLYGVFWACVIVQVWTRVWLLHLLPLPIIYYFVKHVGAYCGLWRFLQTKLSHAAQIVGEWFKVRKDAIIPPPVQGVVKLSMKADKKIVKALENYLDLTATFVVIMLVVIFAVLASVFIAVQVYAEGVHLVHVSGNVINGTLVSNPELYELLPEGWEDMMNNMLNDAYLYGREWLGKMVRNVFDEHDKVKAAQLEKQVVELWDRVYQVWMASYAKTVVGPQVTSSAIFASWDNLVQALRKTPANETEQGSNNTGTELWRDIQSVSELLNISALMNFARENVGILMSVLDSVWSILMGNITLAFSSITMFLSVVFGGGTAVLNFVISLVVFMTALFYLLSASGPLYKPVELVTTMSPSGSRLGTAAAEAVNGVFQASFKMAVFYGLWTWLIHTLFQVNIVFIPSALATLFGAVPFLGTYWACFPATIELWLVQQRGTEAILFFVCHLLPMSVVDTTIYSEIKRGGHPYLTGLAIAGGIFCLGVEGAIIGPLLLCCLFVAMNMYSQLMQESPVDTRKGRPIFKRMDTVM